MVKVSFLLWWLVNLFLSKLWFCNRVSLNGVRNIVKTLLRLCFSALEVCLKIL